MSRYRPAAGPIIAPPWIIETLLDRPDGDEEVTLSIRGTTVNLRVLRRDRDETEWEGEVGTLSAHSIELTREALREWLYEGTRFEEAKDDEMVFEVPVTHFGSVHRENDQGPASYLLRPDIVSVTLRAYTPSDARFLITTLENALKIVDPSHFLKR